MTRPTPTVARGNSTESTSTDGGLLMSAASPIIEDVYAVLDPHQADRLTPCSSEGSLDDLKPLFVELEQYNDADHEWRECARWLKFEEDVEEGGQRWSKPHVATHSLKVMLDLKEVLRADETSFLLDLQSDNLVDTLAQVADLARDEAERSALKKALMVKHRHQHEGRSGGGNWARNITMCFGHKTHEPDQVDECERKCKPNKHLLKKIPKTAETATVMIGHVNFLQKPISCFVRLANPTTKTMGDLTEVPLPTRFLFVYLGPELGPGQEDHYHEVGRAMCTLFSDPIFHELAYKASSRKLLLDGFEEFFQHSTVIPSSEWDPSIRIEPPERVPSQAIRRHPGFHNMRGDQRDELHPSKESDQKALKCELEKSGLKRTGRFFGGLRDDFNRKKPHYWSDFKDGLNSQCIGSIMFIFFAVLAPIITFGGLLSDATDNQIGVIEALAGHMLVGVVYGLCSGQPLSILGATGPVLIFEQIVYNYCVSLEVNFLAFRFWIGFWIFLYLVLIVAFDLSACVAYITRFTEENFAFLIAVIFIKGALQKIYDISTRFPIHPINNSTVFANISNATINTSDCFEGQCGDGLGQGQEAHPNVFLMSLLLFFGTFYIAVKLKSFREYRIFPSCIKGFLSDFAVVIAIAAMTLTDYFVAVDTPKLLVPSSFTPSVTNRTWIIDPLPEEANFYWFLPLAASVPAIVGTILIFMDQQITVVIVNRKEHLLKKGCGYHLDLFIVAIMVMVCSALGFPWCEASTVPSINHVRSLTVESEGSAPGEKRRFLGLREQRVTHVAVFALVGLSVMATPVLSKIPMAVLFGVFLFMGTAALDGLQLWDRFCLYLTPRKFQPDFSYLRRVPTKRVHYYTLIQMICVLVLWLIKDMNKQLSVVFPIMLIVMVGVRLVLGKFFTYSELKALDNPVPDLAIRRKKAKTGSQSGDHKAEAAEDQPGVEGIRKTDTACTFISEHSTSDVKKD